MIEPMAWLRLTSLANINIALSLNIALVNNPFGETSNVAVIVAGAMLPSPRAMIV